MVGPRATIVLRPNLTPSVKPLYIEHKGKLLTTLQLMKLQLAGKLPTPMSHSLLSKQIKYVEHHKRPFFRGITPDKAQSVAAWDSLIDYDYLLGQNKKLTSTVGAIDTETNTCYEPYMLKVDSSQNIWASCYEAPPDYYAGVQEYNSAGTEQATYGTECPTPPSGYISCDYYYGYGYDNAETSSDVFVSLEYFEAEFCKSGGTCGYEYGGGVEYWPTGEPSSTPSLIGGADCDPICDLYYMDADSNGNLWIDYYGYYGGEYGYGVAEIENPTSSSPTFVSALNPGTMECAGGVYVSTKSGTQTVNALDCSSRKIYQFTTEGVETGTIGPVDLFGEPEGLGFNSSDSSAINADCELDWNNVGNLAKGSWSPKKSAYEVSCLYGASYTPSDK